MYTCRWKKREKIYDIKNINMFFVKKIALISWDDYGLLKIIWD